MDALGLQAALVKLDPATTVTPIGSAVKLMSRRHRTTFVVDLDDNELVCNVMDKRELHQQNLTDNLKLEVQRKVQTANDNQQITSTKCTITEVR